MKISLSALMRILTVNYKESFIVYHRQDGTLFIGIPAGENAGDLIYDLKKNVAYAITLNWQKLLDREIEQYEMCQLPRDVKRSMSAIPVDWSESSYQEDNGRIDPDMLGEEEWKDYITKQTNPESERGLLDELWHRSVSGAD